MAQFRVNQRVRIVNDATDPEFNGLEAVIAEVWDGGWTDNTTGKSSDEIGYVLRVDGVRFDSEAIWSRDEFVPIDDGRTVITWEACCWRPPVREGVSV